MKPQSRNTWSTRSIRSVAPRAWVAAALLLASAHALSALPSATQSFSDTYWNNNTGGNTVDGFALVETTGATRASSVNSIYFSTAVVKDDPGVAGNYYYELTWTADGIDLGRFDLDGMVIQSFGGNYRLDFSATSGGAPVSQSFTYNGAQGPLTVDLNAVLFNDITAFTVRVTNLSGATSVANMDLQQLVMLNLQAPNDAPVMAGLNGDSVAWAGVGNTVVLDAGGNAALSDTELGALNGGNGDWSGASLAVQRPGTALGADSFGFNTSGALFSVSGGSLQSGGQTFATFSNSGGVLTITFTSSGTPATTALVNDVTRRVTYRSDTPAGDATVRFALSDGATSATADVTVTSDSIFVTNTADTAVIDPSNGVSFSEAVAIAAADATGTQTIVFDGFLASTALTVNSVSLNESLTFDLDRASGLSLTSGALTLGAGTTQTFTNGTGDTATISSVVQGNGALTKAGAGAIALTATNTYPGATLVAAGTLTVSGGNAISIGSSVAVAAGATLALSANETIGNLSGAGNVTLGSNTLTSNITADTTFSGGISGTGGLTVSQSGAATFALTLSGTNTYTGNTTTLNFGWLRLNGDASVSSSSPLSVNGNSIVTLLSDQTVGSLASNSAGANIQLGSFTLSAGGNNTSSTVSGVISGSGNLVKQGSGTMTLAGTNTYAGSTTVSAGTLSIASDSHLGSDIVILASGSVLEITGATTIDNAIVLNGNAGVSTSASATLSGLISGTGSLNKAGASTLSLTGANTYLGTTTVSAGTLSVASDANLGSGALLLATGSTLAITAATTIDNAIALVGNATVSNAANATLSGVIGGAGNLSKTGAAMLTLSGSNTYSGTTTVGAGALAVASDGNLGAGALTLANGTTLAVTGVTLIDNAVTLSGGSASVNAIADATLSGNISGAGGLTKSGAATVSLSGTNIYTGATGVVAGSLRVNGALSATSGTTVFAGSTLGGSGSIAGNVVVNAGGTLSPGNSPGTLTINGNLVLAAGSTLAVEILGATAGTQYDQVIVNGAVDVSGATLSIVHGYTAGGGDGYTIIVNDAADAVTGSFSGVSEGATVVAGGNGTVLTASYIGATGNDFTLNAPASPTVSSVSSITADGTYKIGDTVTLVVNFSEAVFLSTGTIQLMLETGATDRAASYLAGSGSSSIYFSYTVQEGDLSSDLDYTGTTALAANGDTIQSGSFIDADLTLPSPGAAGSIADSKAIVIDGVRPTASVVVADTALAAGETSTVTITFSEAVSGLATGDFTVANGVLSAFSTGDGGITWSATLTPTASIEDSSNLIVLDNTGVTDAAGNTGTGTTDSNNYAIDTLRPTAGIVVADTALAGGETSAVTITFSEPVSGLTTTAFTVENGVLSGLGTADGGITWTATLTPAPGITDPSNVIVLDNSGVADAAGNTGAGTTSSNNYAIDTAVQTATIVVADTALAAGETSLVTITFSEPVSGLATDDLTVGNGVLSGLSTADGGITWTATLTPDANVEAASNVITLDNSGVQDAGGNAGTGTTDSNNYAIDTLRPTATLLVADTALAVGETSAVTITFSEAVSGLTLADLTVANGTLGGLATADGGITWTATLTPDADVEAASNLIVLDTSGVQDAAGNAGTGSTDSNSYAIDTRRPGATLVIDDTALSPGETATLTITFTEPVSGFDNADLTVPNGSLSAVVSSDGGTTWTATFTPASVVAASNVITLNNAGVVDAAGNAGAGSSVSNNFAINTVLYTVGGTVTGLGTDLAAVLRLNGGNDLAITANGAFTFATGLADGTPYSVTVSTQPAGQTCSVTNGGGTIAAADVTNVQVSCSTDAVAPGAPGNVVGSAGNQQIAASWNAPASDGGSPITGYVATATPVGGGTSASCTTSGAVTCTIAGLVNGVAYQLSVVASNAIGSGPAGTAAVNVTPFGAPGAPTGVQVQVNGTTATISWTPPANDGGVPIISYTVTANPGGATCTVTGNPPPTSCSIAGLTPGAAYTFTVVATNQGGATGAPGSGMGATPPAPRAQPAVIPATSSWTLLLLALLAGLGGWVGLNRRGGGAA
jgi:fibronectin-binding autotransporter adhesin